MVDKNRLWYSRKCTSCATNPERCGVRISGLEYLQSISCANPRVGPGLFPDFLSGISSVPDIHPDGIAFHYAVVRDDGNLDMLFGEADVVAGRRFCLGMWFGDYGTTGRLQLVADLADRAVVHLETLRRTAYPYYVGHHRTDRPVPSGG